MEYYVICRTGKETMRFVDEFWLDEDGNIMFTTSSSFNWAHSFDNYDHAYKIARAIYHKYDEDGYYVYDITVRSSDFITENNLHY